MLTVLLAVGIHDEQTRVCPCRQTRGRDQETQGKTGCSKTPRVGDRQAAGVEQRGTQGRAMRERCENERSVCVDVLHLIGWPPHPRTCRGRVCVAQPVWLSFCPFRIQRLACFHPSSATRRSFARFARTARNGNSAVILSLAHSHQHTEREHAEPSGLATPHQHNPTQQQQPPHTGRRRTYHAARLWSAVGGPAHRADQPHRKDPLHSHGNCPPAHLPTCLPDVPVLHLLVEPCRPTV